MLEDAEELLALTRRGSPDLIAIDEAQFFGPAIVPVIEQLLEAGIQVEVAGLCITYDGGPFEPVPTLMAMAEEVVKLTAVCTVCGADAAFHIGSSRTRRIRCRRRPRRSAAVSPTRRGAAPIGGRRSRASYRLGARFDDLDAVQVPLPIDAPHVVAELDLDVRPPRSTTR